jgi:hypothetical protein
LSLSQLADEFSQLDILQENRYPSSIKTLISLLIFVYLFLIHQLFFYPFYARVALAVYATVDMEPEPFLAVIPRA